MNSTGKKSLNVAPLSLVWTTFLIACLTIRLTIFITVQLSLCSPQEVANPVALLQSFLGHRNLIHGAQTALFLCEDGSFPNCVWFDKRFFALLDHYFGGHSFYAREATYFPSLSLSEDIIQALGH